MVPAQPLQGCLPPFPGFISSGFLTEALRSVPGCARARAAFQKKHFQVESRPGIPQDGSLDWSSLLEVGRESRSAAKLTQKPVLKEQAALVSSLLTQTKAQYPKFPLWEAGTEGTTSPPATAGGTSPRFNAFHPILVPLSPSNDVSPGRAEVHDHAEALGCLLGL